ncbi:sigma factor-like helix-turn-helix DNA-binding protein [Kitasatospora sp. NPDC058170]|uniref:sigma factor-like helix-turn-helix DNA-binding protein n=1 Tax=Kitasatospora sp. NPDC058170 TaxID=3346364 RepID=UPI0036D8DD9D
MTTPPTAERPTDATDATDAADQSSPPSRPGKARTGRGRAAKAAKATRTRAAGPDSGPPPPPDAALLLRQLTPREAQALAHLAAGLDAAQSAAALGVTPATARSHLQRAMRKLGTRTQAELAAFAALLSTPQASPPGPAPDRPAESGARGSGPATAPQGSPGVGAGTAHREVSAAAGDGGHRGGRPAPGGDGPQKPQATRPTGRPEAAAARPGTDRKDAGSGPSAPPIPSTPSMPSTGTAGDRGRPRTGRVDGAPHPDPRKPAAAATRTGTGADTGTSGRRAVDSAAPSTTPATPAAPAATRDGGRRTADPARSAPAGAAGPGGRPGRQAAGPAPAGPGGQGRVRQGGRRTADPAPPAPTPAPAQAAPARAAEADGPVTAATAPSFEELYEAAHTRLAQQMFLLTACKHRALHCVRRAFGEAGRQWEEVAAGPDPEGWVRVRASEAALSPWHRGGPRRAHAWRLPHRRIKVRPADESQAVLPDHDRLTDRDRALLKALKRLSRPQRRALVLHDGLGLPAAAIAVEVESTLAAAEGRVWAARTALAQWVPDLVGTDPAAEGFADRLSGLLHRAAVRGCPAPHRPPVPLLRARHGLRNATRTGAAALLTVAVGGAAVATLAGGGPAALFRPPEAPAPTLCAPTGGDGALPLVPAGPPTGVLSLWCSPTPGLPPVVVDPPPPRDRPWRLPTDSRAAAALPPPGTVAAGPLSCTRWSLHPCPSDR